MADWTQNTGDELAALPARAAEIGYTQQGVRALFRSSELMIGEGMALARADWLTRSLEPLHTAVRLLLLGLGAPRPAAERAFGAHLLRAMLAAGLLVQDGTDLTCTAQVRPWGGLLVASDRHPRYGDGVPEDHILSIGAGTRSLAAVALGRKVRSALDLGSGCGALALQMSAHSDSVLATDLNPRAVAATAFNARLNRTANVECAVGDRFAPAEGRLFDLIVSNPPFVISPESGFVYRDGGMRGDAMCRSLAETAPRHLAEGGFFQMICNWIHPMDGDWQDRLAHWFDGSGCDAWVLRTETLAAADYAAEWVGNTVRSGGDARSRAYREWVEYYQREAIESISAGIVVMRKRADDAGVVRIDDGATRVIGQAGDHIERCMLGADFVARHAPDQLLDARLGCAPELALTMELTPDADGWSSDTTRVRMRSGLAYSFDLPTALAAVVAQFREPKTVREAAAAAEIPDERTGDVLSLARRLIAFGMLIPRSAASEDDHVR